VVSSYSQDVPCIIHFCSSATLAVIVFPGAGVYRERRVCYRCRICTSKIAAEHNSDIEIVDPGKSCYIAIGLTRTVSTDGLGMHIDTFFTVLKIGDECILLSSLK